MQKITDYKMYLENEEKTTATVDKYIRDVTDFIIWKGGQKITKQLVLMYKSRLMEKYSPASVNSVISSLNSFLNFCGLCECKVKTLKIQRQIFASTDKELTKSEYERLLKTAKTKKNKRLYLLMQTICSTGIRVSEHKFITADAVKAGRAKISCKGKMRVVILPKELCQMLIKYMKERGIESGSVFQTKSGKPLDRTRIWREMKKLCEMAKVAPDKVFPHNLRHLFARTFYSIQKDIVRLADILGHSSVNTTRIYTMETGEIHKKQIEKLGLLLC